MFQAKNVPVGITCICRILRETAQSRLYLCKRKRRMEREKEKEEEERGEEKD
jgi:hypothetical protein